MVADSTVVQSEVYMEILGSSNGLTSNDEKLEWLGPSHLLGCHPFLIMIVL